MTFYALNQECIFILSFRETGRNATFSEYKSSDISISYKKPLRESGRNAIFSEWKGVLRSRVFGLGEVDAENVMEECAQMLILGQDEATGQKKPAPGE